MQKRRAQGLCFNCEEKFVPGHHVTGHNCHCWITGKRKTRQSQMRRRKSLYTPSKDGHSLEVWRSPPPSENKKWWFLWIADRLTISLVSNSRASCTAWSSDRSIYGSSGEQTIDEMQWLVRTSSSRDARYHFSSHSMCPSFDWFGLGCRSSMAVRVRHHNLWLEEDDDEVRLGWPRTETLQHDSADHPTSFQKRSREAQQKYTSFALCTVAAPEQQSSSINSEMQVLLKEYTDLFQEPEGLPPTK